MWAHAIAGPSEIPHIAHKTTTINFLRTMSASLWMLFLVLVVSTTAVASATTARRLRQSGVKPEGVFEDVPVDFVQAGACINPGSPPHCALEEWECPPSHVFYSSQKVKETGTGTDCLNQSTVLARLGRCASEEDKNVLTGACITPNSEYFCAVSQDGCGNSGSFVGASDLPRTQECRLCRDTSFEKQTPNGASLANASKRGCNVGAWAGGLVACFIALVVVATVALRFYRTRKETRPVREKGEPVAPIAEIS